MRRWSRRKFLKAGVAGSIAMRGVTAARLFSAHDVGAKQKQVAVTGALEGHERDFLRIAMDEIIPPGDGMPAASEVGDVDYLDQLAGRDEQAAQELRGGLAAIEGISQERFGSSFVSLSSEQRVESLTALEQQNADAFKVLRNYIYEGYYTRPAVWKLIGYEFHATNRLGPKVMPFDEAALAEVRKKPRYYREVTG